jgi:hypothetical protein
LRRVEANTVSVWIALKESRLLELIVRNEQNLIIMSGQGKDLNTSGHICAVVPETAQHRAKRQGERVTVPLMSQAGARNFEYGGQVWWTAAKFARFGFWIHA